MYTYQNERGALFTPEGVELVIKVRDASRRLLKRSGAAMSGHILDAAKVSGQTWTMLAALDYLVERGELYEITRDGVAGQCRVFVAGHNWNWAVKEE